MEQLRREGRPCDQQRDAPKGATCGNCAWIRDLSDYVGDDEELFGLCVEQEPFARVRRDFGTSEMPCLGELWVMGWSEQCAE